MQSFAAESSVQQPPLQRSTPTRAPQLTRQLEEPLTPLRFKKHDAIGPRNQPHARSFHLLRPPPQGNHELPVQQHTSVLPASEFHTNGIILHVDWFLVSSGVWLLSLNVFRRVELGRDSPRFACSCRLFPLLHCRKMSYVNTPRCSSLCVFVDPSQCCIHSATNPHVFMLSDWCGFGSFQLVTIKECHWGHSGTCLLVNILDGFIILYPNGMLDHRM